MPFVNVITSGAPLLSGGLDECQSPEDETCLGGVAAVMAYARNNTQSSTNPEEPKVIFQLLDKNSPFVNMHPLQWVVNRLVLHEIFGLDVFISQPSLLLQNKVDSEVSQRDISNLQTNHMPLLLTNAAVQHSNSWHPYVEAVYFDRETGLAIANIVADEVPAMISGIDAAHGFLNYIDKINRENGCDPDAPNGYQEYLVENPVLQFSESASSNATDTISETSSNQCWVSVILFSGIEPRYWEFLSEVVKFQNPPDLLISLEYAYETFPVPQRYADTSTWVASCPMGDGNYCQQRIQLTQETGQRKPTIAGIEFVGRELESLPEELKDEEWRQNILQLRSLADAAKQHNPVVGYTEFMPISRIDEYRACEAGECPLGSLFTDAIRWFTETDVAFTSSGGYRGEGWPAGPVRLTDLYAGLPFPNTECVGKMSGLSLFKLLNYTTSVSTFEGQNSEEGGKLLQVSGIKVTYNTELKESRLIAVDVWDADKQSYLPLDRSQIYTFSSDSYVCGGYDPYPDLTVGNITLPGEIPGTIGENLLQNIVADYLGSLEDPWETHAQGRLVNDTAALEPLNFNQDSESCPPNYIWDKDTYSCFKCPSLENVDFSDEFLKFEADAGESVVDDGRILLVNREPTNVTVLLKSKPKWMEFTSASIGLKELERVDYSPTSLASGDSLVLNFLLRASSLGQGVDRSALGTVSFSVVDAGRFQGCTGRDATFDVELRVTPPDNYNYLGGFFYVGVAFAAIVFLTSLCFTVFVFINRNRHVIKVMQPVFLLTICLGVTIMASAMIPMGIDDGLVSDRGVDIVCMSIPWLLSTGFTLAFSALFSKLYRINKLFMSSARLRWIVVRSQDVLRPFILLFVLNVGLLIAWTVTDPLEWQRFSIDGQDWDTYGKCVGGITSTIFVSLIAGIDFIALIMMCVQAYQARNISGEFSEAKYIGIAVYSWLQTCLIGVPILFLIDNGNPTALYFIQVALIFVISMSMVSIVFVPVFVNFRNQEPKRSRVRISGISVPESRGIDFIGSAHDKLSSEASASIHECRPLEHAERKPIAEQKSEHDFAGNPETMTQSALTLRILLEADGLDDKMAKAEVDDSLPSCRSKEIVDAV
jgi:hypothetical protein